MSDSQVGLLQRSVLYTPSLLLTLLNVKEFRPFVRSYVKLMAILALA